MLDIFFISYDEEEKSENFQLLKTRFPRAQQIDGVEGIHNAYFEAYKKSRSSHFFTMDADNRLLDDFSFDGSYELVKKFQKKTNIIKVFKNPKKGATKKLLGGI